MIYNPAGATIAIGGTVTVTGTVAVSSVAGTVTVAISGTPNVAVTNTPSVTISGTPTVTVLPGLKTTGIATPASSGSDVHATITGNMWSLLHQPTSNTQATATKGAAAANIRHVITTIAVSLNGSGLSAIASATLNIRDGASGAGTVLWSAVLSLPATDGSLDGIALSGLYIPGSTATAMTIEFAAAGGANTIESVSAMGYDENTV